MKSFTLLSLAGLTTLISATPVSPALPQALPHVLPHRTRQDNGTNSTLPACAKVSQAIYEQADIASAATTQIPAKLAYDCLISAPLNASSARALLEALPMVLEWQSTLTALADPPAEYQEKVQPAVDLLGGLKSIAADIDDGKITTEYDFGWTLYTLIASAHDGHLAYIPDSVNDIFSWGRPVPLVSVSADGTQLPAVFAYTDVLGMQFKNISYTPSPVVEIDDTDAIEFLEGSSSYGGSQDRDALYNNMFYELAQVGLGAYGSGTGMFTGGGRGRYVYPGPTTKLKFENGTTYTMENYAKVWVSFRNIATGEDLARRNFMYGSGGSMSGSGSSVEAAAEDATQTASPGYPVPAVPGPTGLINGFYLDAAGYEDVAVLSVPSFVSQEYYEEDFQATSQKFLAKATADGKTKLILDVQANGGGTILQGYDLFKQLFPDIDPYGANRFRYTEAVDLIGQSTSAYVSKYPRDPNNASMAQYQSSYFDYETDMTADGKPFNSWQEKAGPVEVNGDKYTTLARWNLSDVLIKNQGGINITGYGPLANVTGPPRFKPENIVLLTDGYCASTCTIFAELLTQQAGVKTIALGGRSNKQQIQAIGGVKGVNNYGWGYITQSAGLARRFASPELQAKINGSSVDKLYNDQTILSRSTSVGVNVRDGVRRNDTSGTALQFIYEEANCRLYYTPEMTVDVTAVWEAAADAQWGTNGKCVGGYDDDVAVTDISVATTKKLNAGSVKAAHVKVEDFENSFSLETRPMDIRQGFVSP
ncbi:peptidase S41 family protein [Massarina eburnea CBS 473.64]|uniref:Peptidase S41 family protein n=1 Tax=Massarina eburnea CBS 473.64 TaxID=1395130 RepID=A0A6A6RZ83_9PLEO|nr:peptidase S41 family protein [Massarina eburnea CBS 473.64]